MNERSEEKVKFRPPKDFVPPEGVEGNNNEFDLVCTFKLEKDGMLCLTKLGEHDMEGYDKHEGKENKPDYSSMSKPMIGEFSGGGGGTNPGPGSY